MALILTTLTGNRLKMSPHTTPAWGDPGFWEDIAITRVVGQRAYGTIKVADVTNYCMFGLSTIKTGITTLGFVFGVDVIYMRDTGDSPVLYVPADATEYPVCLIMAQGGGFHCYIKLSSNWIYFGKWGVSVASPLYLSVTNYTATIEADNFTAPVTLRLPAPLSSDGFGGAAGTTDGLGHPEGVAGVIGSGGAGRTWLDQATWSNAGGAAYNAPVAGANVMVNGNMETGDPPTGWNATGSILDGVADERTGGAGIQSLSVSNDGAQYGVASRDFPVAAGTWARFSVWYKTITTSWLQPSSHDDSGVLFTGGYLASGTWANYNFVTRIKSTNPYVRYIQSPENNAESRYDDSFVLPLTLSTLFSCITESTPDVIAEIDPTLTAGTQMGMVLNLDDAATPANFILAYCDGANVLVDKCVAGVYTNVISGAVTYGAGYKLRVDRNGSAIRVYYNNLLVAAGTISDAGILTGVKHGRFSTYITNSCSNFYCYAKGTGGEHVALGTV